MVGKSQQTHRRKTRNRIILITLLALSIITALSYFWFQAEQAKTQAEQAKIKAEQAKEKAIAERQRAIELINYMNFDLRDKLKPIGRLDIMKGVQQHINQFFDGIEINEKNTKALRQKVIGLSQSVDTLFAQGNIEQAEASYQQAHQLFKRLSDSPPSNGESGLPCGTPQVVGSTFPLMLTPARRYLPMSDNTCLSSIRFASRCMSMSWST